MKKTALIFLLLTSYLGFSQTKTEEKFLSGDEVYKYVRIDYSKFGLTNVYINVYEEGEPNRLTRINAETYLKNIDRLYHTLYFFSELPKGKTQEEKEIIFNDLAKHIITKENINKVDLYFNFDSDYSKKYKAEMSTDRNNRIEKISTKITSETIFKKLLGR